MAKKKWTRDEIYDTISNYPLLPRVYWDRRDGDAENCVVLTITYDPEVLDCDNGTVYSRQLQIFYSARHPDKRYEFAEYLHKDFQGYGIYLYDDSDEYYTFSFRTEVFIDFGFNTEAVV